MVNEINPGDGIYEKRMSHYRFMVQGIVGVRHNPEKIHNIAKIVRNTVADDPILEKSVKDLEREIDTAYEDGQRGLFMLAQAATQIDKYLGSTLQSAVQIYVFRGRESKDPNIREETRKARCLLPRA